MKRYVKRYTRVAGMVAALAGVAGTAHGQEADLPPLAVAGGDTLELTVETAVERALGESQEIRLARSQVALSEAQVAAARSQLFPQINANLGYTKTFASAFDAGGGSAISIPDSLRFNPDPTAPLEDRVKYLEDNAGLAAFGSLGALFGDLPFGQENAYTATISGDQTLWSGGRMTAAVRIAREAVDAARNTLTEQTADLELQVRTAYYQALLARELETIALAGAEQAQAFLDQERLRFRSGRASELEVLRAEVELENLQPQLVQARNAAELAELNLKRLTDIPADQPVRLTTDLMAQTPALDAPTLEAELPEFRRASILAAENQVAIREAQVDFVRGSYLPTVSLRTAYGRQAFPVEVFDVSGIDWRTDWTATLNVSVPVFTGFRRGAEIDQARVQLEQARLQVEQLREAVQLEYTQARGERERAQAAIGARERTVEQAQRVHDLTVLRYEQGLATQLEVTDARLALLQARTNLAQAIADYYIADASVRRALGETDLSAR